MQLRSITRLALPLIQGNIKTLLTIAGVSLLILVFQFTVRYHGVTEEQEGIYSGLFRFWLALLVTHIVLKRFTLDQEASQ